MVHSTWKAIPWTENLPELFAWAIPWTEAILSWNTSDGSHVLASDNAQFLHVQRVTFSPTDYSLHLRTA